MSSHTRGSRTMRITFVLPGYGLSGGNRVVAMHIEGLLRLGHEVLAVAPPPAPRAWSRQIKDLLRGRVRSLRTKRSPSYFAERGLPHRVLDRYRPVVDNDVPDADVVIATWWETAEWVGALRPSKGAKAYFVQHHEVFPYLPVERAEATYRTSIPKIAVARWLADLMKDRYGNPPERVFLVPNAVDHNQFHALPRSRNNPPVVGMMYSTAHFKGADIALRAYELAARNVSGLRLVAFGAELPHASLPIPSSASYTLLPPQDRLRHIYASCDVWLFASRDEGYGLPLLEAMACRTPVVATPAGAAPELIVDGGGVLVRPEDPEDMAHAIEEVCRMPEDRWRLMSDRAHETALRHSWGESTALLERALMGIASGVAGPAVP